MLRLVKPTEKDKEKYIEMIGEWKKAGGPFVPCIVDYDCNRPIEELDYAALLKVVDDYSKGNIAEDDVAYFERSDFYFIYDDEELVGVGEVRHNLRNLGKETLGHIACGIRPAKRNQGYATMAVEEMLEILGQDRIDEVVLCHYDANKISPKIIDAMGFTYTNAVISNVSGKKILRYTKKSNINN